LAGWNSGFGKCVIIEHANGLRTLYGHLNTVMVHVGQKVKRNQYIGRVGSTGRTTGPHLHFTIWKDGKLQDPLKYLW
jgi:murein DD-endopeptidase MepM/ murein hydrolase activator NlpD